MWLRRKTKSQRLKSVIHPQILASIALKNLLAKRLRTLLTVGGIVIGVGAIVFLVSLADGLHQTVNHYVIGSRSVKTVDVTSPNALAIPLTLDRINKIHGFSHVTSVAPAFIIPGKVSSHGSLTDAVIYGTNNEYINLSALKFVAGKSSLGSSKDAIISTSLLSLIGSTNQNKSIGQKIKIISIVTSPDGSGNKQFEADLNITGVVSIGSGVAVYIDGQLLQNAGEGQYGQVKVVADSRLNVPAIRQQISGLGLSTASPLDTLGEINTIFAIFTFVVMGFGGIGMIIAVLGMFNTLTISLLERTSEIGLMITMGARKADVQRLLIFEALLLSLLGGAGGIITAWILGLIINLGLTHFAHARGVRGAIEAFAVTPLLVCVVIVFTLLIGLLVAFYPSRRAAKINPVDALRHE